MPEFSNNPVSTYDVGTRRDFDVTPKIQRLVPEDSLWTTFMTRARVRETKTATFYWYDSVPGGYNAQLTAGYADGASTTNITVPDSSVFQVEDIIKNTTSSPFEIMQVVGVVDATNVTVQRAYGSSAAAHGAGNVGDWLVRLGNAMEENSVSPAAKMMQPTQRTGYCQIFRTPFDESMTSADEAKKTAEDERTRLRRDKLLDHRCDMERAFLFSQAVEHAGDKRRLTDGLLNNITNIYDCDGVLTQNEFELFCEMLFQYGSRNKGLIASTRLITIISGFAQDRIKTKTGQTDYGLAIVKYISAHGELKLFESRTLENDYANTGIGVDLDNCWLRPLRKRGGLVKLWTNTQENNRDGWMDEYIGEVGLQVMLPQTHAFLKNAAA